MNLARQLTRPGQVGKATLRAIDIVLAHKTGAKAAPRGIGAGKYLIAAARQSGAVQAGHIAKCAAAPRTVDRHAQQLRIPLVAPAALVATLASVLAGHNGGIHHTSAVAHAPDTAAAKLAHVCTDFGVALQRQPVRQAIARSSAHHQPRLIRKRAQPIVFSHRAQLQRPIEQTGLQQLRRTVQGHAQRAPLTVDIGNHHLRHALTIEHGNAAEHELPRLHLLTALAQAVDIQIYGRRQHRLALHHGQRRGDAIRLQAKIARQTNAANTRGAGPGD